MSLIEMSQNARRNTARYRLVCHGLVDQVRAMRGLKDAVDLREKAGLVTVGGLNYSFAEPGEVHVYAAVA